MKEFDLRSILSQGSMSALDEASKSSQRLRTLVSGLEDSLKLPSIGESLKLPSVAESFKLPNIGESFKVPSTPPMVPDFVFKLPDIRGVTFPETGSYLPGIAGPIFGRVELPASAPRLPGIDVHAGASSAAEALDKSIQERQQKVDEREIENAQNLRLLAENAASAMRLSVELAARIDAIGTAMDLVVRDLARGTADSRRKDRIAIWIAVVTVAISVIVSVFIDLGARERDQQAIAAAIEQSNQENARALRAEALLSAIERAVAAQSSSKAQSNPEPSKKGP